MKKSGSKFFSYIPMAYKLSILIVSILVTVTVLQGWVIASQQASLLEKEMLKFGFSTTRLFVAQVKEPLLAKDDLRLEQIIQSAVKDESIAGIKIIGNDGQLITQQGTVNSGDHQALGKPIFWQDIQQRHYISLIQSAHSNDIKVGEVIVTIHADALNEVKRRASRFIIVSTLMIIIIGIIMSAWLSTVVTQPIIHLIDISKKIAEGDYQERFSDTKGGELSVLSKSLGVMTDKLLQKLHIEQTFSRYVSPKVAKEVLADLAPQELGGKEINGSVLFADIVGFTSISEKLKAHEVSQLLNDYFSYIDQAALHCNGHVDKYMGDCAMVLFGVPEHDPRHTFNAVYCALLIQETIRRLNIKRIASGEVTVLFSVGVNSGNMLAGNMGSRTRMEYTVLGDTVNIASRLASVSNQGEIIITEQVAKMDQITSYFDIQPGQPITLKGKAEAMTPFSVTTGNQQINNNISRDISSIFSNVDSGN